MRILVSVIITFFIASHGSANEGGLRLVKSTIERYQKAKAVEIKVSKIVTLALLDEKKESEGMLFFSKGKMRLSIEKPEEYLIIMGKNEIWVITPTAKELGGRTQVMKIRSPELSKQAKSPLAALLGRPEAWDNLKLNSESATNGSVKFNLEPKVGADFGDIVSVNLEISQTEKTLLNLSYKDELDNETEYKFKSTNFKAKITEDFFKYSPPKDADITEY
ncbi:MAG: hypothetical protein A2Z20_01880 [Bdellovibrionales bacterium RBG_16_40_8]|nr:MAG: hypothetical protein A2Z20_01880 [Bdellovibrionales bacterium RBG_16_40_8]